MRFLSVLLLAGLILGASISSAHAGKCYSQAEAEAEQGVRIHSELMVIGLNCQHMTPRGWKNFYSQYREFTNRHKDLFSSYENTMISYLKRNGGNERKFHEIRTGFANKVSTDVAKMRPDVFCATFAPRIPKVAGMTRSEFQNWVASSAQTQPLTQSICR